MIQELVWHPSPSSLLDAPHIEILRVLASGFDCLQTIHYHTILIACTRKQSKVWRPFTLISLACQVAASEICGLEARS